ncbi:Cytochrome P450 [Arachis hypogaea]|uniref:Cytochrome P450 n=1 Tax=Arachis hypogaea TaxID=3818 RepID=A0A6B9VEB6_ARAHY|nr:Cytochrome P450 [Arachis hypogaea]
MAVVIFHHLKKQQHKRTTLPPGPKPLPIIGNLHQLDSSNLNLQLWNLSKIYGSIFSLQIGFKPAIVISSPKLAKEVLKDHDLDVSSRPPSLGTTRLSYNGFDLIFSPCIEYWREIRKICVVHFFSSKRISGFYHIRKSEVERMLGKISEHDCVQKKIRSLYGKKPFIEDENIEKLVYLKAVIKETSRYYAPAPLVPREFNKNSRIAGYEIEAKTIVYVNVFAIHRDPETWKDPEGFSLITF